MDKKVKLAIARVVKAGILAPESVIIDWIKAVGAKNIMEASLANIRMVASSF